MPRSYWPGSVGIGSKAQCLAGVFWNMEYDIHYTSVTILSLLEQGICPSECLVSTGIGHTDSACLSQNAVVSSTGLHLAKLET